MSFGSAFNQPAPPSAERIDYRSSGVDIHAGDALVDRIKRLAGSTRQRGLVGGIGGFAGLFRPEFAAMRDPLLVSSTDGVGTKLLVAQAMNIHDTIGQDLVAMAVNDVAVCGAEVLFLLDYFACGKLDVDVAEAVVAGIAEGCRQADCALLGGETAEMPGVYPDGAYDLAAFAVGLVDRPRLLDGPATVKSGDRVLGIASSGFHSNGYSLLRKVVAEGFGLGMNDPWPGAGGAGRSVGQVLLTPTRIYVKAARALAERFGPGGPLGSGEGGLRGLAHITGGGLTHNIPRVLPPGTECGLTPSAWIRSPIFDDVARAARLDWSAMAETLNCGLGLVAVVSPEVAAPAKRLLEDMGEQVFDIGEIRPHGEIHQGGTALEARVVYDGPWEASP